MTVLFQKLLMESDIVGYIYKITNKLNQKVYIGKTLRDPKIRWREHIEDSRHPYLPLQRAFNKYGIEAFEFTVLEQINNDSLLNEREKYYINKFNSYKKGYNATIGGDGGTTHLLSDSERKKILQLWEEDKTILEIQRNTGHSYQAIHNCILSTGISQKEYEEQIQSNRKKQLLLKKAEKEQIQNNRKKQLLLKKTEKEKEYKKEKFTKEEKENIFKMFQSYYSCNYIAKQIGCSYKKMFNFLKQFYTEQEIEKRSKIKTSLSKHYYKYTIDNKLEKIYKNREELKKDYSESQIKVIQNCARGVKKTAYGFKWTYSLEETNKML